MNKKTKPQVGGRPKTGESIRNCVIRIRKETGWGYTKILQTLRRLGHRRETTAIITI